MAPISLNLDTFFIFLFIFGTGRAILLATEQIILTERKPENIINAWIFFVVGTLLFQCTIKYLGFHITFPFNFLFLFQLSVLYALGPLSYLYPQTLVEPEFKFERKHFLMFIPAIFFMIVDVSLYFLPEPIKSEALRLSLGNNLGKVNIFNIVYTIGLLQALFYHGLFLKELVANCSFKNMSYPFRAMMYMFSYNLILITLLIGGIAFGSLSSLKIGLGMTALLTVYIDFLSYSYPNEILNLLRRDIKKKKYEKTKLSGLNVDDVRKRLSELMEEEMIFCDEGITLAKVAEELSITTHQLSEFLNSNLNLNFSKLINYYRIKEAVRLMDEEPKATILEIAYSVGFNSRSTFNAAFSYFTGVSPSEYRKNQPDISLPSLFPET